MKEKKVILIKLGGSLITNKSKPFTVKQKVLEDVIAQVGSAVRDYPGKIILGHGSGSFAHVPAEKYKTIEGNVGKQGVYGFAVVEDAASKLNRIVVDEMLKLEIPALSMRMANMITVEGRFYIDALVGALETGLVPVFFGDPILGGKRKFTIWSTEKILNWVAEELMGIDWRVEKIIHCGEVDGFIKKGRVLEEINLSNFGKIKQNIKKTRGFDVTGGMLHKVQEALETAGMGVESYIIGGNIEGNLYKTVMGSEFVGTRIKV